MTGCRSRRLLVGVGLLVALMASPATAEAEPISQADKVDPFCVGITDTWVEACVGSLYGTVKAVVRLTGRGMPF